MFISCKRNLRTFPSVKATRVLAFFGGGEDKWKDVQTLPEEEQDNTGMEPEYFVGSERFVSAALGTETCQSTKR